MAKRTTAKGDKEYEERKRKVIEVFKVVLNSSTALDACSVQGRDRAILLSDPDFKLQTRAIKANKYIEEIKSVEKMLAQASGLSGDEEDAVSVRGGLSSKEREMGIKDALNLQEKLTARRRELLSLTSGSQEAEEENALNIFFIPVSKEEYEKIEQVEINEGTADGATALQEATAKNPLGKTKKEWDVAKDEVPLFSEGKNGVIEEI